jgi:hypothetical protein
MVKPPIKKIFTQTINSSIFDDIPPQMPNGGEISGRQNESSYMNVDSNLSNGLIKGSDNNIPGWSFISPTTPDAVSS